MEVRAPRRGLFRPGGEVLFHARRCFLLVWFPWELPPLAAVLAVVPPLPLPNVLRCCCCCCALRHPRSWPPERSRPLWSVAAWVAHREWRRVRMKRESRAWQQGVGGKVVCGVKSVLPKNRPECGKIAKHAPHHKEGKTIRRDKGRWNMEETEPQWTRTEKKERGASAWRAVSHVFQC